MSEEPLGEAGHIVDRGMGSYRSPLRARGQPQPQSLLESPPSRHSGKICVALSGLAQHSRLAVIFTSNALAQRECSSEFHL